MRSFTLPALLSLSMLAACGGGGGGGLGSGTLLLTQANAQAAASEAFDSATGLIDIAGNNGLGASHSSDGVRVIGRMPAKFDLSRFVRTQFGLLPLPELAHAIIVEHIPCPNGGEIVQTWNDADDSGAFSPGDTLELQFVGCVDEDMVSINGRIMIDEFQVSGSFGGDFSISIRMTFDNLTVTEGADSATLIGSLAATFAQTGDVFSFTLSVSVSLSNGTDSYLGGTTLMLSANDTTGDYSMSANGGVSATALGGSIVYVTPVPFTGNDSAGPYPSAGVMILRGANNSTVTITALDGTNVQIDVDEDGDGTPEATFNITWSSLDS